MDETDNENLLLMEIQDTRGHCKKLRKGRCLNNIKKSSFLQRNIEVWNKLSDDILSAKCVQRFKGKLDKCRYGDRTTQE